MFMVESQVSENNIKSSSHVCCSRGKEETQRDRATNEPFRRSEMMAKKPSNGSNHTTNLNKTEKQFSILKILPTMQNYANL